jgi:hypothetical protein
MKPTVENIYELFATEWGGELCRSCPQISSLGLDDADVRFAQRVGLPANTEYFRSRPGSTYLTFEKMTSSIEPLSSLDLGPDWREHVSELGRFYVLGEVRSTHLEHTGPVCVDQKDCSLKFVVMDAPQAAPAMAEAFEPEEISSLGLDPAEFEFQFERDAFVMLNSGIRLLAVSLLLYKDLLARGARPSAEEIAAFESALASADRPALDGYWGGVLAELRGEEF